MRREEKGAQDLYVAVEDAVEVHVVHRLQKLLERGRKLEEGS